MNVTVNATATLAKNVTATATHNLIEQVFTAKIMGITALVLFLLLCLAYVLISSAGPYFSFGLKVARARSKLGNSNMGFLFLRNKSNNLPLPEIIDLRSYKFQRKTQGKEDTFLYAREQLATGKFFGTPYCIFDDDDNKTSIGLYYANSDEKGDVMYDHVIIGYDEKKMPIIRKKPSITAVKPAVTLPPEFYKAILDGERMSKSIKDFMDKYQTLFYCILGIGGLLLIIGWILYTVHSKDFPAVLNACKAAASNAEACKNIPAYLARNGSVILR